MLSVAAAYLRALEGAGVALDAARGMIGFRLSADADEFLTIAKFRALRLLWARIETACGLAPAPAFISAETAWRTMAQRDPWTNMLRGSIAAFAAGVGGADAITVLPFTAALGLPDPFARRIARNIQLLLLEESNIWRVGDPAAGSGGIEDLTQKLAQAAWALFQNIEKAGGAPAALEAGLIQGKVAAVRAEREKAVALRREVLTGTNDYPLLGETTVDVLDVKPVAAASYPVNVKYASLPAIRLAEPFEKLRDAADRALAKSGSRPKVFLANIGTPAEFNARATFAKNFFEAGGIEAVTNDGFADDEAMNKAFKASGAEPGLSLFLGRHLCSACRARRQGAGDGRLDPHLLGRPAQGCRRGQGRRHRRLHLRRLRCARNATGGAPAAFALTGGRDDRHECSDRRLPVRPRALCDLSAARRRIGLSLPDVPEGGGRAVHRACARSSRSNHLDPRQARFVPLLQHRDATLLRRLRHAACLCQRRQR